MTRRPAVILATADARGRVLLVKQRGGALAGQWLLPGGRLEAGENLRRALSRELREETGLSAKRVREVARYRVKVAGDSIPEWLVHLFRADITGRPRPEEGSALAWRDPQAGDLPPLTRRELVDAGLRREADPAIAAALARAGINLERLS